MIKSIKKICIFITVICIIVAAVLLGYKYYTYGVFFVKEVKIGKNWETVLINNENHVAKDYEPELTELSNGERVDERIYPMLQSMFDDARNDGFSITVSSGYRSWDEQEELWEEEIDRVEEEGVSMHEAMSQGLLLVQRPGMSEHQTGLAVDIDSAAGVNNQPLYNWLKDNSYKYGFILRYPQNKVEITKISFEPWHFRYVGTDAAEIMKQENLCLEEYVEAYVK